jgi:hypothetical protein
MRIPRPEGRKPFTLTAILGILGWLIAANAHAQAIRVTAANASNGRVYDVFFAGGGGTIEVLNNDANQHVSLRSLVFVPNTLTGKIDLLVSDASRGEIVRYADSVGAATVIWSVTSGPGPTYPDGLSVDGAGNLFVVSSASGNTKPAELWVFPRDPAAAAGAGFLPPRLIDNSFAGLPVQSLEETLVSRTTSAAAESGDLLVLTGSPATVLVYSHLGLQAVIDGSGPISPVRTLISSAQFPAGVAPGGMDFWPADNSLLITTANGTILRYSFTATSAVRGPDFATGLGNGKFKVKTGVEASTPLAFVANNNGGEILQFGSPPAGGGANPAIARVTNGVQRPQGLAASNLAARDAADCLEAVGGCELLGNVLKHTVSGLPTVSGYVIEDVCLVPKDPRIAQFGSCTGHSLPVNQVCAGFGDTVIPDFMCGGSGTTGKGFALVKSVSNSLNAAKGALISNEAFSDGLLSGTNAPCPATVLGWAPTEGEGSIVEGNNMLELTGGCGSSKALSRGLSVWGIGLVLNEAALPGKNTTDARVKFAITKYDALNTTISLADILATVRSNLSACMATSRKFFDQKKYGNAAAQLVSCDALVAANEAAFSASANNPNPSAEIRGRLANLHLTINSRIQGNTAPGGWPPP